ncbi:MAG: hypothetical protein ABL895_10130 [Cyclobacteriaceae bacterium]
MKQFAMVLWIGLISFNCLGQNPDFTQKLMGAWSASGTAFGKPAKVEMIWTTVLKHFSRIEYKIMTPDPDSKIVFEGTAYYKQNGVNSYGGTWFDSGGEVHSIQATNDQTTLTSIWGKPEGKFGKTIYKLIGENELEISDYIMTKEGAWREFSKNVLSKN